MESVTAPALLKLIREFEKNLSRLPKDDRDEKTERKRSILQEKIDALYVVWGMCFGDEEISIQPLLKCEVCGKFFAKRQGKANNDICGAFRCRAKYKN